MIHDSCFSVKLSFTACRFLCEVKKHAVAKTQAKQSNVGGIALIYHDLIS